METNQILFECRYDENDLCRLESFDGMKQMIIDSSIPILSNQKPNRPLSDLSSILKSTKNGYKCKLPYRIENNLNDIYFCYKYSSNSTQKCQTTNGFEDECQQGKYEILLLENIQHRLFITPIINSSKNSICLTYYYYLTDNKTVLLSTYYLNDEGKRILIDKIDHITFNGWNFAQQYFMTNSKSFQIIFEIYRYDMSNTSQPFYVAFDQITLIEPIDGDTFSLDKPKENLPFFILKLNNDETSTSIYSDSTIQTNSLLSTTEYSSQQEQYSTDYQTLITDSQPTTTTRRTSTTSDYIYTSDYNYSTSRTSSTTTITESTQSNQQYSLTTVLGLSIGLGIPAALGVIGFLIYIIKKVSNRTKITVQPVKHVDNNRRKKSKDIHLKKERHDHHRHHNDRHQKKKTKRTKENIL